MQHEHEESVGQTSERKQKKIDNERRVAAAIRQEAMQGLKRRKTVTISESDEELNTPEKPKTGMLICDCTLGFGTYLTRQITRCENYLI